MFSDDQSEVLVDHNRNQAVTMGWRNNSCKNDTLLACDRVPKETRRPGSSMQHQPLGHEINVVTVKTPIINCLPADPGETNTESQSFTELKDFRKEHSSKQRSEMIPQADTDDEDVLLCEDEVEDKQDDESKESIQKRVCLVKLYAWIKEEMSKTAAKSVASHLYEHDQMLLSRNDHESICHCSWRRDAVEQLLKKVLMGPCDIHEVFINALKDQEESHIAEKLVNTHASDSEIEVFTALEQSSLQNCLRPHSNEPRFTVSSSDDQTLLYYLNNKNTIDSVNDNFLSRFIFSIREHTNICLCALDCEKRVRQLIETMKLCSDNVFEEFCEILSSIEMCHVVRKLEKRKQGDAASCKQRQKRKYLPGEGVAEGPSTSTAPKRRYVNSSIECQLVSSMQRSSSTLRLHAVEQLGFDVENINNGSIVIQLCPKHPDSWEKLEQNCRSGKIKDFIPVIYNNGAIATMLQEGEYRLQFTIYTLPAPANTKEEEKKVLFHLETEQEKPKNSSETQTCHHDNMIEDHMDLLCEELEIDKDFLGTLKKEKLVEVNIKEEMDKQGSRVKKIKYLLKKVGAHGAKGYEILKEHIKENNEDLYKELCTREAVTVIDSKIDHVAKVTKKSSSSGSNHRAVYKKEVFFTGTVVLNVKKNVTDKTKENVNPDSPQSDLDISCPEILNPVCHFQMKGKGVPKKSGELTMVLEDTWSPVGTGPSGGREILIGKRKSKDRKTTDKEAVKQSSKRVHNDADDSDGDDDDDDVVTNNETDLNKKSGDKETTEETKNTDTTSESEVTKTDAKK